MTGASNRDQRSGRAGGRDLTEIEAYALGVVDSFGEATAYRIRRAFATSPSAQGRGSAGSIYPSLQRLERRGLIRSRPRFQGRRESRLLSLTARGRRALARWLSPPLPEELALPLDPLRARVRFLGALSPSERIRFLEAARDLLVDALERLRSLDSTFEGDGSAWEEAMAHGAELTTRARLAWIEALLAAAEGETG